MMLPRHLHCIHLFFFLLTLDIYYVRFGIETKKEAVYHAPEFFFCNDAIIQIFFKCDSNF